MSLDPNSPQWQRRDAVSKAARAFFRAMRPADWLLGIALLAGLMNAPALYRSWYFVEWNGTAMIPSQYLAYWAVLTFVFVLFSVAAYLLYLVRYTSRFLGMTVLILHTLNFIVSAIAMFAVFMPARVNDLPLPIRKDYWTVLVVNLGISSFVILFMVLRLAREQAKSAPATAADPAASK